MKLKSAVVFSILMEGGGGILTKSPGYILEKLRACSAMSEREYLAALLDRKNQAKLREWEKIWEERDDTTGSN